MADQRCRVCGLVVDEISRIDNRDAYRVRCQRCGLYGISGTLQAAGISTATQILRAGLKAALREASERGEQIVLLTDNWEAIALPLSHLSVRQKLRRLLEFIGDKSQGKAGTAVTISDELDHPRFAAVDNTEYHWLRRMLLRQKLIEESGSGLSLTLEGWEEYRPGHGGAPGTCFVAMAFDESLTDAYEQGIRPAIVEDCGYSIIRLDQVEHNDNINDKMIAEIRSCQFLVADFTEHRNGVYFEAGFAMGLGRSVVWTCRKDHLREAHFDTRPYNHVVWETPAELRERLRDRIRATIKSS